MKSLYKQSKPIQWFIAFLLFTIAIGLMTALVIISLKYSFFAMLGVFIIIPIIQFLSTPFYTIAGFYQYLSPMLLVFNANDKLYDLHNGTSFDYLLHMRNIKTGREWQKKMLLHYFDGLLAIIKKIEEKELPKTVIIKGSSYFFSERTAAKLGFEIEEAGFMEKFNLLLNYLDLMWTYSLSKGKISFPNLFKIKKASILGSALLANKEQILVYRGMIS